MNERQALIEFEERGGSLSERITPPIPVDIVQVKPLAVHGYFLDGKWALVPASSSVSRVRYSQDEEVLDVMFNDGRRYRYYGVDLREAWALQLCTSAGSFVWDYLRVRGSKILHRKRYVKL